MDQCEPEWYTPGQCSVEASGHGFPAGVVIKRGVACGIGSFIFYSGQQNPSRFFSSSLASASSYACMQIRKAEEDSPARAFPVPAPGLGRPQPAASFPAPCQALGRAFEGSKPHHLAVRSEFFLGCEARAVTLA